jgi:hypothetical protein
MVRATAALPLDAPLEALSPAAMEARGIAKAAATDTAIRVFILVIHFLSK